MDSSKSWMYNGDTEVQRQPRRVHAVRRSSLLHEPLEGLVVLLRLGVLEGIMQPRAESFIVRNERAAALGAPERDLNQVVNPEPGRATAAARPSLKQSLFDLVGTFWGPVSKGSHRRPSIADTPRISTCSRRHRSVLPRRTQADHGLLQSHLTLRVEQSWQPLGAR